MLSTERASRSIPGLVGKFGVFLRVLARLRPRVAQTCTLSVIPWLQKHFSTWNRQRHFLPLQSGQVGSYVIEARYLSIYDEVNADIYLVPGNSQFSGEMAFYCQQRGKKYVFLAGSDIDFSPEYTP